MKTMRHLALAVLLGCAGCMTADHATPRSSAGPILLAVTNSTFRLGPPEGKGGGFYVLEEIESFIPKKTQTKYDYIHDYSRDVQATIKEAKTRGEDVAGLNTFFGDVLPRDKWARETMFVPRLILRCLDGSGKRVWVIHMNWEYYSLPSVTDSQFSTVGVGHVVTYVVDYETGAVIYKEKCT